MSHFAIDMVLDALQNINMQIGILVSQ